MKQIFSLLALLFSLAAHAAAPAANDDSRNTPSNAAVTFSISANDVVDVGKTLDLATVDLDPTVAGRQTTKVVSAQGTYTVNNAGSLIFTPGSNYTGTSTVTYTVQDNTGTVSNVGTVRVYVGPLAVVDAANTPRNAPATVNVLGNDTDVNGLSVTTLDLNPGLAGRQTSFAVTGGSFACDNAGNVTFTPSAPYSVGLVAVVQYTVDDVTGSTSNITTYTVTTVNVAPAAANDVAFTPSNTVATFSLTANDTDSDGTLVLTTVDLDPAASGRQTSRTASGQGSYTVDNAGNITFTPNLNYTGTSAVVYAVTDNDGTVSNIATVTVNVGPLAVSDAAGTTPTLNVTTNVLINDNDVDGLAAGTVDLVPGTAGRQTTFTVVGRGIFTVDNAGNVTFQPTNGYVGSTAVSYVALDLTGATSNVTTFTVTTSSLTPIASDDSGLTAPNVVTPLTVSVIVPVTTNDIDPGGNLSAGTVDLDPGTTGTQTSRTVAGQGVFTTVGVPAGSVRFTPDLNFTGSGVVAYTVQNTSGTVSNAAALTVRVGPVAVADGASVSSSAPTTFNILANDIDGDGLALGAVDLDPAVAGQQVTRVVASRGTFSLDPATGLITFTPSLPYTAGLTATISYLGRDNFGAPSNAVNITVTTINTVPVAGADVAYALPGQTVVFSVTANDSDLDGTVNANSVDLDPVTAGRQTTWTYIVGGVTLGTFSISGTVGNVQWAPTGGAASTYTGTAVISYTVNDNTGAASNTSSITLRVGPRTIADAAATLTNTAVALNVLANDIDEDGLDATGVDLDPATAGIQNSWLVSGQGNFVVDNTGNVTFTPEAGYVGTSSVSYTALDLTGAVSNAGSFTVTVANPNLAPTAVADDAQTPPATSVTFSVTGNDSDADGTVNVARVDLDPSTPASRETTRTLTGVGTFTVDALGNVTFVPVAGYTNTAGITYTVEDNSGVASNAVNITVRVGPLAVADVAYGLPGTDASTTVTTNDSDANGVDVASVDLDPATSGIQTTFAVSGQGAYAVDATGVVSFTPGAGYTGTSSVSYTVNDLTGATSASATLSVRVGPQTTSDAATTFQNVAVSLNVTTNDTDADGLNVATVDLDPLTAGRQTSWVISGQGTFAVNATGVVTFTPVAAFVGTSSVNYVLLDNTTATSTVGTFTVTVVLNQLPVAVADNAQTTPNTAVAVAVTANDSDPDGTINGTTIDLDPVAAGTQTSRTVAGQGTFTTVGQPAGTVLFTPVLNFTGTSSTNYTVRDAIGAVSNVVALTVRVGPRALNDATQVAPGATATINAPGNDVDANGLDLTTMDLNPGTPGIQQTAVVVGLGTFSVNATTGVVTFVPSSPTATGTATLTYTINDATGATSNVATITVNIVLDGPPVSVNDEAFTPYLTTVVFAVTANDVPPSGGTTINPASIDLDMGTAGIQNTFTIASEGTFTTVSVATGVPAGSVRFVPVAGFTGNSSTPYTVNDNFTTPGPRTSNQATLTVRVGPQTFADTGTGPKNIATVVDILSNDVDVDGVDETTVDLDPAVAGKQLTKTVVVSGVTRGTFAVSALTGLVTFTPTGSYTGLVTLTYTVLDNTGATSIVGTLNYTVLTSSAPVAANDLRTTLPNTALTFNVLTNDTDAEGNATIVANTVDLDPATAGQQTTFAVAGQGDFSVNATGDVTFTPGVNFTGVCSINYTVQDAAPTSYTSATANAANGGVIAVNVGPLTANDASTTRYNVNRTVTVTTNDVDANGLNAAVLDIDPLTAGRQTSVAAFIGANQVGTWSVNNAGAVTFTALAGARWLGVATLSYVISDNTASSAVLPGPAVSNVATYSLTLTSAAPVAVADTRLVVPNAAVTFNVVAPTPVAGTDTDADGNTSINRATVDLNPATAGRQSTLVVAGGTFGVDALANVTFTPNTGFTGTATAQYTVQDTTRTLSNAATIRVELGPVTANDAAFVLPNTNRTIAVLTNDVDASGFNNNSVDLDPATANRQTSFAVSGKGTFSVNAAGVVTFAPTANYTGTASASYIVFDVLGAPSLPATISVVVGPRAIADAINVPYSSSPNFSLTANDLDVDGLNLASIDLDPSTPLVQDLTRTVAGRGTFTLNPANDGTVTFAPIGGYVGTTAITYTLLDALGAISNAGTITVTTVNNAPVALADVLRLPPNTTATFSLTANDTDVEGPVNATTLDLNPSVGGRQTSFTVAGQGTFTITAANNGTVSFAPVANFTGTCVINYFVADAKGTFSNQASATAHVGPLTVADAGNRASSGPATVNVTANDTDLNNVDPATVDLDIVTAGRQTSVAVAGGTFSVDNLGNITFTPTAPFVGGLVSTVQYSVLDVTASVSITSLLTVTASNTAPIPADDGTATLANTSVSLNVTPNDTDSDGTIDLATVDLNPGTAGRQTTRTVFGEGNWSVDNAGIVTFVPVLNYTGTATLQYVISDNGGSPAAVSATITVRVGPLLVNDAVATLSNATSTLNLVTNDIDTDGLDLTSIDLDPGTTGRQTTRTVVVGGITYGTFALPASNNGTVVFTPAAPYASGRVASITYQMLDQTGALSTIATITVTTENAAPAAAPDNVALVPNTNITFNVLANDTDPDNAIMPATLDLDPSTVGRDVSRTISGQGVYTVDNAGNITFTPFFNYTNTSTLAYTVQDAAGLASSPGTIAVRVGPLTVNDASFTPADTPVTFNILANDTDVNGLDPTTLDLDAATAGRQTTVTVARGIFTLHPANDGRVIFTPIAPFVRNVQAVTSYRLLDLTGAPSDVATYTVTTAAPLPVELLIFEAKALGTTARLAWRTATEKDNDHFLVERSTDGRDFAPIGTVAGQGSKPSPTDYTYVDENPTQPRSHSATRYYRLRQVDRNGTASFSPVRAVTFAPAAVQLGLYPQPAPATATLDMRLLPAGSYQVVVFDATGRTVLCLALPAGTAHTLPLQALPSGTYQMQAQGAGGTFRQRLLKE